MKLNWKHYTIIAIALILAVAGFFLMRGVIVSWSLTDLPGIALVDNKPVDGTESPEGSTPEAVVPPSTLPEVWNGASRVNILVMGLDFGDWSADRNGASRTDSMILFTIDPITKTAGYVVHPPGSVGDHSRIRSWKDQHCPLPG